jgi:hypothetical protein
MFVTLTIAGSSGTGTATMNDIMKTLEMKVGQATKVVINGKASEKTWVYTALMAALRLRSPAAYGRTLFLNPTLAGNSTYYGMVVIPVGGLPGHIEWDLGVGSSTDLTGLTGVSNMSFKVSFVPIAFAGQPQGEESLVIGKKAVDFDSSVNINEVMLASQSELASYLTLKFAGVEMVDDALIFLEDLTHDRLTGAYTKTPVSGDGGHFSSPIIDPLTEATAMYVLYITDPQGSVAAVKLDSSTDTILGFVVSR